MGIRRWKLPEYDRIVVERLASETGRPELVCRILAARGRGLPADVHSFLDESAVLDDPFLIADMEKAVARIWQATHQGERVCVYGDYDCDGVTATVLLSSYLQSVGADAIYYVPSREREGYGLNKAAVDQLKEQAVDLIVTVDNGISAHEEIDYAASLGIDVVVTDHHTPRETLPNAVAVVNPHRADCPSRFKDLAGVGVAFKLVCAMENVRGDELLEYYSDIVALGTIADVVPLSGENRVIVRHGLKRLCETENQGLAALVEVSAPRERKLTSESLAFGVIPRINAAGRMGDVDGVVELLLTDDADYAAAAAKQIDEQNALRKKTEADILVEINRRLEREPQLLERRILILAGEGWNHGVVGIVSAKLVERYDRPCIVVSVNGAEARASGRSVKGFSLIEAIAACSHRMTRYGGHTLAAGFTLPSMYLEEFSSQIEAFAWENYAQMPVPELTADAALSPRELTVEKIAALSQMEPFGAENEAPMFYLSGLRVDGVYPTAGGNHMRVRLSGEETFFYAIYFGVSETAFPYQAGDIVEIMARISVSEYNGKQQVSVKIADLRLAGIPQEQMLTDRERYRCFRRGERPDGESAEALRPAREDVALVYRYLRRTGSYSYGPDALYQRLMASGVDYARMCVALDVLEEMGFVRCERQNGQTGYAVVPDAPKADLANSTILLRLTNLKAEILVNESERV